MVSFVLSMAAYCPIGMARQGDVRRNCRHVDSMVVWWNSFEAVSSNRMSWRTCYHPAHPQTYPERFGETVATKPLKASRVIDSHPMHRQSRIAAPSHQIVLSSVPDFEVP